MRQYSCEPLMGWEGEALFIVVKVFSKEEDKVAHEASDEAKKGKYRNCYYEKVGEQWHFRRKGTLAEFLINFLTQDAQLFKEPLDSMRGYGILKSAEKARYSENFQITDEQYEWLKKKSEEKISYKNQETGKIEETAHITGFFGVNAAMVLDALNTPVAEA